MKNIFFEDEQGKLFGQQYGPAIRYTQGKKSQKTGYIYLHFERGIVIAEDPINFPHIPKIDLVCECIRKKVEENDEIAAVIYGKRIRFTKKDTVSEIQEKIKTLQKRFIKIRKDVNPTIKNNILSKMEEIIKDFDIF